MTNLQLSIQTRRNRQYPVLAEEILLERRRAGAPAKLEFTVINDSILSFHEGDHVLLQQGEETLFSGFVFSKHRNYGKKIKVMAYDQMRYLKNKDTYSYEDITASQLIGRIGADWGFALGEIDDSLYPLPATIAEGRSLMDIIQTALDQTAKETGELFTLYDKGGKLCLSHVKDLARDTLISTQNIKDFDYTSSIDRDAYSAVRLYRLGAGPGQRIYYDAENGELLDRWGRLRYHARAKEEVDGIQSVQKTLEMKARKTRILRIQEAMGDTGVQGGSLLPVELNLGDLILNQFLMVEQVRHRFTQGGHTMDLSLVGGDFVA